MTDDREAARRQAVRAEFNRYILGGIPRLRRLGYNPFQFLEMIERYGDALGATKHLLASGRHTSYGFQRLLELNRLEDSVEFAACLPWFEELFEPTEIDEARTRLIMHEFPLDRRLTAAASTPPGWTSER